MVTTKPGELQMFLGRYRRLCVIAKGGNGQVFKCQDQVDSKIVAVKSVPIMYKRRRHSKEYLEKEWSMLRYLSHKNIIIASDSGYDADNFYVVMEYVNFTIGGYIQSLESSIEPDFAKRCMYQILSAVDYCHDNKIVHCDIKPPNILMDATGVVKLADFGSAFVIEELEEIMEDGEITTLWYRAPEALMGCGNYGFPIDMWAVGCVFFEMISGYPMFTVHEENELLVLIFSLFGTPSVGDWPELKNSKKFRIETFKNYPGKSLENLVPDLCDDGLDLLNSMLTLNPSQRISAKDALKHPYIMSFVEKYMKK